HDDAFVGAQRDRALDLLSPAVEVGGDGEGPRQIGAHGLWLVAEIQRDEEMAFLAARAPYVREYVSLGLDWLEAPDFERGFAPTQRNQLAVEPQHGAGRVALRSDVHLAIVRRERQ